jgi:thiol-disulfide isomerase/thioredoxin
MRYLRQYIFSALVLLLTSYPAHTTAQSNTTVFISNPLNQGIEFNYIDSFVFGRYFTIRPGQSITFPCTPSGLLINTSNENRIYFCIQPGDSLEIYQTAKGITGLKTIQRNTRRDDILGFFTVLADSLGTADRTDKKKDSILSVTDLKKRYQLINTLLSQQIQFLDSYRIQRNISDSAWQLLKHSLQSVSIINHLDTYSRPGISSNKFYGFYQKHLPAWRSFFTCDSCIAQAAYRLAAINYAQFAGGQERKEFSDLYPVIKENFTGQIRDFLLTRVLLYQYKVLGGITQPLDIFYKDCRYQPYKQIIGALVAEQTQLNRLVQSGDKLLTPAGDTLSWLQLLKSKRDSIVYADLWASWCQPCLAEMPFSHSLSAKFKNQPVSFIYISYDTEVANWLAALQQQSAPKGNHYLLIGNFAAPISKKYNIISLPRYIIINKTGAVINNRAPRPSSPALQLQLFRLLQ